MQHLAVGWRKKSNHVSCARAVREKTTEVSPVNNTAHTPLQCPGLRWASSSGRTQRRRGAQSTREKFMFPEKMKTKMFSLFAIFKSNIFSRRKFLLRKSLITSIFWKIMKIFDFPKNVDFIKDFLSKCFPSQKYCLKIEKSVVFLFFSFFLKKKIPRSVINFTRIPSAAV